VKKYLVTLFITTFSFLSFSQLNFQCNFQGDPLKLDSIYELNPGEFFSVKELKFYLSDFLFYNEKGEALHHSDTLIFYDLEEGSGRLLLSEALVGVNKIEFLLGLDSLKNVSGALEGPYDPLLGMYWAWNTGYINFKLKGTANWIPNLKNDFEFHIGGYRAPYGASQKCTLFVKGSTFYFNLDSFLQSWNLKELNHLMVPGEKAFFFSRELVKHFHF
jgi:hypothetical protein